MSDQRRESSAHAPCGMVEVDVFDGPSGEFVGTALVTAEDAAKADAEDQEAAS